MMKAIVRLGLVPFGGSKEEVAEEVLRGLDADENGCVPYEKFKVGTLRLTVVAMPTPLSAAHGDQVPPLPEIQFVCG